MTISDIITYSMNTFPIWHLANVAYNGVNLYRSDDSTIS